MGFVSKRKTNKQLSKRITELVREIKATNSEEAKEEFCKLLRGPFIKIASKRFSDYDAINSYCNTVLTKLLCNIDSFNLNKNVVSFCYTAMSNYCIDELRKLRAFNRKVEAYKEVVRESENINLSVEFILEDIAGPDRQVVKDYFIENMELKDIANKNAITQKEVRTRIYNFRTKIKEYVNA